MAAARDSRRDYNDGIYCLVTFLYSFLLFLFKKKRIRDQAMPSFSWVWNQKRKRKENTNKILKFSLENDFVFSFFFLSCLIQTDGRDSVRMHHKMPLIRSDPLSTVWPLAQGRTVGSLLSFHGAQSTVDHFSFILFFLSLKRK